MRARAREHADACGDSAESIRGPFGLQPTRALLWVAPLAALLGAGIALLADSENGARALHGLRGELHEADGRIDGLLRERADLAREVRALRSDPLAIESAARVSLGMVRKDELVIRLREADPSPGD